MMKEYSLFDTVTVNNVPSWMEGIEKVNIPEKEHIDLGFEKVASFAAQPKIVRDTRDYTSKTITAHYNNKQLETLAKIELSKFLAGKYYDATANVKGNAVMLTAQITNIPGQFKFMYMQDGSRVKSASTFTIDSNTGEAEYPFSRAGLDECIADIKSGSVKTATKAKSYTAYTITLEEIARRFNGDYRTAIDKARELVKSGEIIGVGSNTFATVYDINDIFPKIESDFKPEQQKAVDLIENTEHVEVRPFSSAAALSMDASKMLASFFDDFKIVNSFRDNNELLVKANVLLKNNTQKTVDFTFGINNDNLQSLKCCSVNDNTYTLEQLIHNSGLLENYLEKNKTTAKKIYRGRVMMLRDMKQRLASLVNNETAKNIIQDWAQRNLIDEINSTRYATKYSFEELLNNTDAKLLTASEKAQIHNYLTKISSVDRIDIQDTGIRNDVQWISSKSLRLANIYNELAKHFDNFDVCNIGDNAETLDVVEYAPTGKNVRHVTAEFNGNKLVNIHIDGQENVNEAAQLFMQGRKHIFAKAIFTKNMLKEALGQVFNDADKLTDAVIANTAFGIDDLGNHLYSSNMPFAAIINAIEENKMAHVMSEQQRKQIAAAKANFGNHTERIDIQDTGIRNDVEISVTDERLLNEANSYLTRAFNDFKILGFKVENDVVSYNAQLFDNNTGLSANVAFTFHYDDNHHVKECEASIDGKQVNITDVTNNFAKNDILAKYIAFNGSKKVNAPIIIRMDNLVTKLANITAATVPEIKKVVFDWCKAGKIHALCKNAFASNYTVEQLISTSNLRALSEQEIHDRLAKQDRTKSKKVVASHIKDSGLRDVDTTWSEQQLVQFANSEFNKLYNQFKIITAKVNDNKFIVEAIVNNSGVRSKVKETWEISNGRPVKKTLAKDNLSEEIERYANNNFSQKIVISNLQLKHKLLPVIDIKEFDNIVNLLQSKRIISKTANNVYASSMSLVEIVNFLKKNNMLDVNAGKEQIARAQITDARVKNLDIVADDNSRNLEHKAEIINPSTITKLKMEINNMFNSKKITAKTKNNLLMKVSEVKTNYDIASVNKEMQKWK